MTDAKHSVIGESQQTDLRTAVYNAYGERNSDSELQSLLAFNGEVRDEAGGWYLLGRGYRAYNPCLMRFHSPDSMSPFGAGGINPYMYCAGDPINFSDPTGHFVSSGNEGTDLMIWGAVDMLFGLISGNVVAFMAGFVALQAGAHLNSRSATDSEKQTSSRIGFVAGLVGMFPGGGARKAADITNYHHTTNINLPRRNSAPAIMDGVPTQRKPSTARRNSAPALMDSSSPDITRSAKRLDDAQMSYLETFKESYIEVIPKFPKRNTENFTLYKSLPSSEPIASTAPTVIPTKPKKDPATELLLLYKERGGIDGRKTLRPALERTAAKLRDLQ